MYSVAKFEVEGEELIIRDVKKRGNSGGVTVPVSWVGESVAVIRKKEKETPDR